MKRTLLCILGLLFACTGCANSANLPSSPSAEVPKTETPANQVVLDQPSLSDQLDLKPISNIKVQPDHRIVLGDSDQVPHLDQGYERWGMVETKPLQASEPFRKVHLILEVTKGADKDQLHVEYATSADGVKWSEYEMLGEGVRDFSLMSDSTWIKLRITILGMNANLSPVVNQLGIQLKK